MTVQQETKLKLLFTNTYNKYKTSLTKHAFFKISDPSLVEDLVQTTFLKTWSYLKQGGQVKAMQAFLYRILNNLIVDEYRKYKAKSLDELVEAGFEPGKDDTSELIDALDGKRALSLIHYLPLKYRQVVSMRFVKNLSLEEMSKNMAESKNALAVRSYRGVQILKSLYFVNQI